MFEKKGLMRGISPGKLLGVRGMQKAAIGYQPSARRHARVRVAVRADG
jgi:hypothetical protein